MGGGIILSEVGFDLDDASSEAVFACSADKHFPQELAGYAWRVAHEEGAREWMNRSSAR